MPALPKSPPIPRSERSFDELMTEGKILLDLRDHAENHNLPTPAYIIRRLAQIERLISNPIMDEYLELTMQN